MTYPALARGAANRLAHFKREALLPRWANPVTWRNVRFATLKSHTGMSQGFNGTGVNKMFVWYCHHGEQLRNERDSHVVNTRLVRGWYTDTRQEETAIGIVAGLPHGRFIAGYRFSDHEERVYFPEIYTDESDAAHAGDSHAETIADIARDNCEITDAACALESDIETALIRLRECLAMRHYKKCLSYVKDEITTLLESIRQKRETLHTDFAGYF